MKIQIVVASILLLAGCSSSSTDSATSGDEPAPEAVSWTYDDLNGGSVTIVYDPEGSTGWATDEDGSLTVPGPIDYIDSLGDDCALLEGEYDLWANQSNDSGNSDEGRARMSAYAQYAADQAEDAGCS